MGTMLDHRRCAEECVAMARLSEDDKDKALWLTLAQSWCGLPNTSRTPMRPSWPPRCTTKRHEIAALPPQSLSESWALLAVAGEDLLAGAC